MLAASSDSPCANSNIACDHRIIIPTPTTSSTPCGEELLRSARFPDCTIRSANCPRASDNIHADAGVAAKIHASPDRYRLAQSVCRSAAQSVLAAVFQNQSNRSAQAFTALLYTPPLSVGAGNLRRPGNKPFIIPLNDSYELIPHGKSIERKHPFQPFSPKSVKDRMAANRKVALFQPDAGRVRAYPAKPRPPVPKKSNFSASRPAENCDCADKSHRIQCADVH